MPSEEAERDAQDAIDVRGKTVPTFILYEVVVKLRDLKEGDVLEVLTDEFEPIDSDVRAWCRTTGHNLVGVTAEAGAQRFRIEKGAPKQNDHKLAIVISHPGLEELLSPLGFALGAALGGGEVSLYFQGPAVRVLKQGFSARLQGIGRFFSAFARAGMAKTGHIPPQEKLRQLHELGAKFYVCGPSMQHFGVNKSELAFDGVVIGAYATFTEVMNEADVQLYI